jgi:hypothetical protein
MDSLDATTVPSFKLREVGGPFVADGWLGYFCFVVSPFM